VALPARALHVGLPGHEAHGTFAAPPPPGRGQRFVVPGSAVTVVVEDSLAHAEAVDTLEAAAGGSPALHFVLRGSFGQQDGWLVAGDPDRSRLDFGPVAFDLSAAPASGVPIPGNRLAFTAEADGTLRYALTARQGRGSSGAAIPGQAIRTPWMGMEVLVERYLPRAVPKRTVSSLPPPLQEERRVPALRVSLQGPSGTTAPEWILWNEVRQVAFGDGHATLAFRAPESPLPFRVTLLDFQSEKYPGSERAATYQSRVRVEDAERGSSEHVISMNHPLRYRGYVFFQSSFVEAGEGQPAASIFSVARAPGLPLVYAGTALITLGLGWMFYGKPWLARRRVRACAVPATA